MTLSFCGAEGSPGANSLGSCTGSESFLLVQQKGEQVVK